MVWRLNRFIRLSILTGSLILAVILGILARTVGMGFVLFADDDVKDSNPFFVADLNMSERLGDVR